MRREFGLDHFGVEGELIHAGSMKQRACRPRPERFSEAFRLSLRAWSGSLPGEWVQGVDVLDPVPLRLPGIARPEHDFSLNSGRRPASSFPSVGQCRRMWKE